MWGLLKGVLPEFKLPLQEWQKALLEEEKAKKEEQAIGVNILIVGFVCGCLTGIKIKSLCMSINKYIIKFSFCLT